jgi:hypothetical protein
MAKMPAYVTVSLVFFILILLGFAYSWFFFPNQHPFDCWIKSYTGKDCPTCGFSRSFSCYSHCMFSEGKRYNGLSFPVFLFFCVQFLWRLIVLLYYFTTRKVFDQRLVKIDVIISISLFLLAFLPIILNFYHGIS